MAELREAAFSITAASSATPRATRRLAKRLEEIDAQCGTRGNRLFYLSVAPSEFEGILENLKKFGLNKSPTGGWTRVIVEKPFGYDLATAQELNTVVNNTFAEADTFRIDHFLGKETAQNIMVLRFANAIFEPLWNHRYIDHVQITASEPLGVEGRGPYYDSSGRAARHGAESSAPVALPDGDGAADRSLRRQRAR